jgi:hypothetical protein
MASTAAGALHIERDRRLAGPFEFERNRDPVALLATNAVGLV